jgi:hypothetical protein
VSGRRRAVLELVLAALAAAGCVASWLGSRSTSVNPSVHDGAPSTSVSYYPPLLMATFLLAALAGSLLVVGIANWRRRAA